MITPLPTKHEECAPGCLKNGRHAETVTERGGLGPYALTRQSICTAEGTPAGCALTLHETTYPTGNTQRISPAGAACLWNTSYQFGFQPSDQRQKVFIRAGRHLLESAGINLLPKDNLVFKLDFTDTPDKSLIERCRTLHERGFSLALGNYSGIDERSQPLLSLLDMVEINLGNCNENELQELAGSLAKLPIQLLANGIDSAEQLALCKHLNFDYFQGTHVMPATSAGQHVRSLSGDTRQKLLEFSSKRSELSAIENFLKRESLLIQHLLGLSLRIKEGSSTPPGTLRGLLATLGAQRISEWLQSILEEGGTESPDNSTTDLPGRLAALRGRMLELLAQRIDLNNTRLSDSAYLAGCLSTVIDLPSGSSSSTPERRGFLGQLLDILDLFDRREADACQKKLQVISKGRLQYSVLSECFDGALSWLTYA